MTRTKQALSALVLIALVAMPVAAATVVDTPAQFNFGSSAAQNPKIGVTVTKDVHKVGEWSAIEYEGDNGELHTLDAHLNESNANPVTFVATEINASDFTEFPRKGEENNAASWADASEWTKDMSGSAGTGTIAETTTAPNVQALTISTSNQGSGDVAKFKYSNFSIDSDESKRVLQLAVDVNSLDAAAHVEIQVRDADGDYKNVTIDPDADESASDVLANATGVGNVLQVQLGTLTTRSDGDGDGFDNIKAIHVVVEDADADLTFTLMNAEKLGKYTFGEHAYDGSDDDSEKDETRTIYEPHGPTAITGVATLGDTFSTATLRNAEFDLIFATSDLSADMDFKADFSKASAFPGFEWKVDYYARLKLPSAYDLAYSSAELRDTVALPGGRYLAAEYSEGVGDTEFGEISSWTSFADQVDSQGDEMTIDSTIQPGQQIAIHYRYTLVGSEKQNLLSAASGGVVGMTGGGGGGGIVNFLLSLPGMIISGVVGLLGFKMARG